MRNMIDRRGDEGSAFVISILVLFVLSVLGLALMLTTTTEKDIAINYRWGEQAFFNADAALEYGKNELANYALANQDFLQVLPPARASVTIPAPTDTWGPAHPEGGAPCDPQNTPGCRDYQYFFDQCPGTPFPNGDQCARTYIGRVLQRQDGTLAQWDFRAPAGTLGDLDNDGTADIDGSFTIWVRRPVVGTRDYGWDPVLNQPDPGENNRVILTAEGTAPNGFAAGTGRPVSVRRLEMSIRIPTDTSGGQVDKSDASNADGDGAGSGPSQDMSSGSAGIQIN